MKGDIAENESNANRPTMPQCGNIAEKPSLDGSSDETCQEAKISYFSGTERCDISDAITEQSTSEMMVDGNIGNNAESNGESKEKLTKSHDVDRVVGEYDASKNIIIEYRI